MDARHTAAAAPALQALSRPEHLLVWALRVIAIGHEDCPVLVQTFDRTCGPLGLQALAAYHLVVCVIGMTGRRRLKVHVPGCPCVSADEQAIVAVVSAAPDSLDGDEAALRAGLRTLIEQEPAEALVIAAQAVGRILQAQGLDLPHAAGQRLRRRATVH